MTDGSTKYRTVLFASYRLVNLPFSVASLSHHGHEGSTKAKQRRRAIVGGATLFGARQRQRQRRARRGGAGARGRTGRRASAAARHGRVVVRVVCVVSAVHAGPLGVCVKAVSLWVDGALDVLQGALGGVRKLVFGLPDIGFFWAFGERKTSVVAAVAGGVFRRRKLLLEVVKVVVGGDGLVVQRDLHQAVVVALHGILVHKTARENRQHLVGENGQDLSERSGGDLVAAKLGEEQRDGVVVVGLDLLVVAGRGEGRAAAPRVVVEAKHVHAGHLVVATVEVVRRLQAVLLDVGGRVAHRDKTQVCVALERLDVTHHSLDVDGSRRGVGVVDHLVAGKETQRVVVLGHELDRGQNLVQVHGVVGALGALVTRNQRLGHVDVQNQVDARVRQLLHALVVVGGVVDGVDTDGVDAELLEVLDVTLTRGRVGQRVVELARAAGLVVEAPHVEAVLGALDEKGIALDFDRVERIGEKRQRKQKPPHRKAKGRKERGEEGRRKEGGLVSA